MKTAMQEWTEWLKAYEYELPLELQIKAKELLEKEKQQIIDAHTNGHNDSYEYHFLKNSANEISLRNGEEYYNQTFKPETI